MLYRVNVPNAYCTEPAPGMPWELLLLQIGRDLSGYRRTSESGLSPHAAAMVFRGLARLIGVKHYMFVAK